MNKTLLWLFWKDVLNCSLWIAIWAFGSLWSQEHSGKGNVKNNACMHLLGYAYPVWEAWETSGKGNMVYAQHSTTLERKRLFEAVTEGAQFLGSPYLNVTMQSTQHLPVSNSPGEGSWWGAWTTDLAGWPQRTGISGQQQVIGFGSFETLKQFVQLLNTMKCVCHTILVCTPLLQSPSVVWSFFCCCPLCLECDAVALCEYEPVLCFGANHFLKRPYRFSFKSKHQKASKENI